MSSEIELFAKQGANLEYTITLTDETSNAYINLANYSFMSQMRASYYNDNIVANLICTKTDSQNGELTISLGATTTLAIRSGRYVFDVIGTDSSVNTTDRIIEGQIIVTSGVTR
jgi:hypothetical protein